MLPSLEQALDAVVTLSCDSFHQRDKLEELGRRNGGQRRAGGLTCSGISRGHAQRAKLNLSSKSYQSDVR